VSFATITLCIASQRVFIFYKRIFLYDSVRKLLDTPSYSDNYLDAAVLIRFILFMYANFFGVASITFERN
jgi:hypothetical protein